MDDPTLDEKLALSDLLVTYLELMIVTEHAIVETQGAMIEILRGDRQKATNDLTNLIRSNQMAKTGSEALTSLRKYLKASYVRPD